MNAFNFLPEDYEAPKSGGYYMKIAQGENRIRILSQPILGWEDWIDNKPMRFTYSNKPEKSNDPLKPVRHFWAFIVWNYNAEQIQILQITQSGIRNGIEALCHDTDWGAPYFYDMKIIKEGEDKKTKYKVNPLPHKPVAPHIVEAFNAKPIYLEALFQNEDPFATHWGKKTPGVFSAQDLSKSATVERISSSQAKELEELLNACDPKYKASVMDTLARPPMNVKEIAAIPASYFDKIKTAALKKRDEFKATKNEEVPEWIK
jgi:hypothetical protein